MLIIQGFKEEILGKIFSLNYLKINNLLFGIIVEIKLPNLKT